MINPAAAVPARLMLTYYSDDREPLWKLTILKIGKIAIQIIVPFSFILAAYLLLPAVVLPVLAIGAVFTFSRLFACGNDSFVTVPYDTIFPPAPPAPPPVALSVNIPRGFFNRGNNCWANALAQVLCCEKSTMDWIGSMPKNLEGGESLCWAPYIRPQLLFPEKDLEAVPKGTVGLTDLAPTKNLRDFQTAADLADRIKVVVQKPAEEAQSEDEPKLQSDAAANTLVQRRKAQIGILENNIEYLRAADLTAAQLASIGAVRAISFDELTEAQYALLRTQSAVRISDLTAPQRTAYLDALESDLVRWATFVPELRNLPFDVLFPAVGYENTIPDAYLPYEVVFPANGSVEINIPEEYIEQVPVAEREALLASATTWITEIRVFMPAAYFEQFPAAERNGRMRNLIRCMNELRKSAIKGQFGLVGKQALYDRMAALTTGQNALTTFTSKRFAAHIPLDLITDPALPLVLPPVFLAQFPGEDPVALTVEAIAHITNMRNLIAGLSPEVIPHLKGWMEVYQTIQKMDEPGRQNLLRYVNFIQSESPEGRSLIIDSLNTLRDFFKAHNDSIARGARVSAAQSRQLREVFHNLSGGVIDDGAEQEDPEEALTSLSKILPPEFNTQIRTTRIYRGLNSPEGTRVKIDPPEKALLKVPMSSSILPSLDGLVQNYLKAPNPTDTLKIGGKDYTAKSVEIQLMKAPEFLSIQLKRFGIKPNSDFFFNLFPWLFPRQPAGVIQKIDSPIVLSDTFEIETVEDGPAKYRLDSFIYHQGRSKNGGHYIAYIKGKTDLDKDIWYELDDSGLKTVSGAELEKLKSLAYIVHYTKITG